MLFYTKELRKTKLDLAWQSIETNQFGIDEFVSWCQLANVEVMGAVNMGTGTIQDAQNIIEYCNFKDQTYYAELRKKNGFKDPHNIKLWCIGNEMDGPWQIGHLSADDYGKKALETAKVMKWVDNSIELVVCGSSNSKMDTFPEWDRKVLEYTYDHVDYLSMHVYYENTVSDIDFLASFVNMNNFIKSVCATADYVKALKRSDKTMYLSFDEYNIWYHHKFSLLDWQVAPPILEDNYSVLDALTFGGLLITLLNNSDRVKIACLAQLVNVIAPIFTKKDGGVFKQTIYFPFQDFAKYGHGYVLTSMLSNSKIQTSHGETPTLITSTILNHQKDELTIFVLNILEDEILNLDLKTFNNIEPIEHRILKNENIHLTNTFEFPNAVCEEIMSLNSTEAVLIPKLSWNVLRYKINEL